MVTQSGLCSHALCKRSPVLIERIKHQKPMNTFCLAIEKISAEHKLLSWCQWLLDNEFGLWHRELQCFNFVICDATSIEPEFL